MKKFGLFLVGLIALMVVLAQVGPLISLALCLVILYFGFKQYVKAESKGAKISWAILSIIMLMVSISHFPAVIGLVAAYILYLVYKKWKEEDEVVVEQADPFMNFERQWQELNKK
ncbi:flagellar basal body rod protein [Peribacillus asahii]|uniref:lmo0954 family membrane protein n=1 Tax=Peribacillus asahii TaxID=228899 RepID=UPI00381B5985